MTSLIQYRPLFSVVMLHDYYLSEDLDLYNQDANLRTAFLAQQHRNYQVGRDLTIQPTLDCLQNLKDLRLLFKKNNRGFLVVTRGVPLAGDPNGAFVPFRTLDAPFRLRFTIDQHHAHFQNITNLNMDRGAATRESWLYYFSNRAQNSVSVPGQADLLYLSQTIPDFDVDRAYEAGEIHITAGDDMMEALEDVQPGSPLDPTQWRTIYIGQDPHFQFVTSLDRVALRPRVFHHPVRNQTEAHASLNVLIWDLDDTLVATFRFDANDPLDPTATLETCMLDLSGYASGLYRLEVQQTDATPVPAFNLTFYMDDALFLKKPLALIECFHEPGAALGAYRFLDEGNSDALLQPVYRIRWKNRPTWWRYYYEEAPTFTVAASDVNHVDATPGNPNHRILITRNPMALTDLTRRVELALTEGDVLLPNPSSHTIYPEAGRIFSEINMGGGLGPPD